MLSCDRSGVVEDPTNPGFVKEWINVAQGLPSKPAIRQPGDPAPTYNGGRFGNPANLVHATQPALTLTGGGQKQVLFDRSRTTNLLVPGQVGSTLPDSTQRLATAYQFTQGGDATLGQTIFSDTLVSTFRLLRTTSGGGDALIFCGGSTTVAGDHPNGTFIYTAETGNTALWQKDGAAFGTGTSAVEQYASGTGMWLGRDNFGNYLDGTLDQIHIWTVELSPSTVDFIWQTINADGTDFATETRAPMSVPVWSDLTGDAALDQYDRLRSQTGFPHRYVLASLPASPALHRVQIAAAVDGLVLPDSQLGGDLFTFNYIELPGPPIVFPVFVSDPGWSAVMNFDLNVSGHYTIGIIRENGGQVILHFDVETP